MAGKTHIQDGTGSRRTVKVTEDNALLVSNAPITINAAIEAGVYHALAAKHVLASKFEHDGSTDMSVNGSVTAVEFGLSAESGIVKAVRQIRLILHDAQMNIANSEARRFGGSHASGLANGLRLYAEQGGVETDIFLDPVQEIQHFYNYMDEIINDVDAVGPQVDLLIVIINLFPEIYLVPGETDKLAILVQDNLIGLDKFETLAFGTKEEIPT